MSNKKKSKKMVNKNSGKKLSFALLAGTAAGLVLGIILLFTLNDIFYFGIGPMIGLIIGFIVGTILENKENQKHIHNTKKAIKSTK